ncbi:MAG: amidophosphoribosyltransferase [Acidimicrobiales bacterium]
MVRDGLREACGVFGILAPGRHVAQPTFDGLYALQHRGQESAGMAVSDGETVTVYKDMGLVSNVFDARSLSALVGDLAIGHTRYSTTGSSTWRNAQPVYRAVGSAGFALGHNGNLTNTAELAAELGMLPGVVASDSDLIAELVARELSGLIASASPTAGEAGAPPELFEQALVATLPRLHGAYSLVCMDDRRLVGIRDPNGFRPLCLGRLAGGWVLASESPALDVVGASFERELDPGEMVVIDAAGPRSLSPFPLERVDPRLCLFELVYFARPDARLYGKEVHGARRRMGEALADTAPVEADLVMGVPDSGLPAAEGYSGRSGIPYGQGLVKNRYIGRTFIAPDQQARDWAVRRKLNPLRENIAGRRLVVVDDSIVRGTTTRAMVAMLREAGAREVHLRVSSPPYVWPCHYGIDTPDREHLLAANRSVEEIRDFLGADSIAYLGLDELVAAIGAPGAGFCDACLTGRYPVAVPGPASGTDARRHVPMAVQVRG